MSETPPTADSSKRSLNRAALALFAAVLLPMVVLFHPQTGWNVNTRLALVLAVVNQGTFSIDTWHDVPPYDTEDKAFFDGKHYSDKIFGVGLLALPFVYTIRLFSGEGVTFETAHVVGKTFAVALPGAVAAGVFFLLLARLGCPPRRAVLLTAFAVFGTMWFGYGTVFYPYMVGVACCLGALWVTLFPRAGRVTLANSFAVGGLLGYALLSDLIFNIAVFAVGVVWLLRALDQVGVVGLRAFAEMTGERSRLKHLIQFSVCFWIGVLIPLGLFAAYCYSIFGEFSVPYKYEVNERFREGMAQGVMGVTAPKLHALWFITVHPFRGILFWSPVMLAGIAGCVLATGQYGKRCIVGWMGLLVFAGYLLFNAGYYMWWDGWGMGPRFLIPAIPFLLLGLGEMAREGKLSAFEASPRLAWPAWIGTVVVGVGSVLLTLPLSLFDPQLPQGNQDAVLAEATLSSDLNVPQFKALEILFSGQVTVLPHRRLRGEMQSSGLGETAGGIVLFLLLVGGPLAMAWKWAPEKIPGLHRADYPFRTIDGTAAPPPPRN